MIQLETIFESRYFWKQLPLLLRRQLSDNRVFYFISINCIRIQVEKLFTGVRTFMGVLFVLLASQISHF